MTPSMVSCRGVLELDNDLSTVPPELGLELAVQLPRPPCLLGNLRPPLGEDARHHDVLAASQLLLDNLAGAQRHLVAPHPVANRGPCHNCEGCSSCCGRHDREDGKRYGLHACLTCI